MLFFEETPTRWRIAVRKYPWTRRVAWATVRVDASDENISIWGIWVHVDYRRMGYGTKVTKHALKKAKKLAKKYHSRYIWLRVRADNNVAINMYKKLGFVVDIAENINGENHVRMKYGGEI